MNKIILSLGLMLSIFITNYAIANIVDSDKTTITKPFYIPLVERYVLDELKSLRQDQQKLRLEMVEKLSNSKLDITDRALRYTADTTNNIFYIITIAVSLLVLLGWRSLQDVKNNIKTITTEKISKIIVEYEKRLDEVEAKLKRRSEQIVNTQQDVTNANIVHSLWMRAGLEKSEQEKISIYDEILAIKPEDIQALTYKADVLLDIDEDKWSLSLSNKALAINNQYALAFWQRACAHAKLGQTDDAIEDIKTAIILTPSLKSEIINEVYFANLKEVENFQTLVQELEYGSDFA